LFVLFGSPVGVLTVATLVSEPLAGAVTVTVTLLTWPLVKAPKLQLTRPLLFNPPPVALTKVTLAGSVSVTTTLLALDGPKFVTEIVYVRLLVALTTAGADLPSPTSATGVTVVPTGELVLLPGFGSAVVEVTVALFVTAPLAGAVTVIVTFVVPPLTRFPKTQLTIPALVVPPLLALMNTMFVGNTSLATTLLAVEGPEFVTVIV
jgi:hypothetical protein